MNTIIKPTWKNILICMILFYLVGDTLETIKIGLNTGIKKYQSYQYYKSDEYKQEQLRYEKHKQYMDSLFDSSINDIRYRTDSILNNK